MKKWMGAAAMAAAVAFGGVSAVSAQTDTAVTILHGIPGITVDLQVDGEVVIAGFDAGDTQDLTALAGMVLENIVAVRAGSDEVVIGPIESFTVPEEGNNSVVVHLDNTGAPTITPFPNSAPPTEQGRGLFTVRHVADAAPVAVVIGDEVIADGIGNGEEGGTTLPAGEVTDAWVTVDGERIAAVPTLVLEANSQLIVYLGGSLEADNLEFYVQQVSDAGIESLPSPSDAEQSTQDPAPAAQADDDAGDGTPQPDVVNTGDAITESSRNSLLMLAAAAFVLFGILAAAARRQLLASSGTESIR